MKSFIAIVLSAMLGSGCAAGRVRDEAAQAAPPELEAAIRDLASALLSKTDLAGRTLAVGEFSGADGRQTGLSSFIAERLEMGFVERSKTGPKILSRGNLGAIVAEWELSVGGQVDDDALIEAGKLLGAQTLCAGRIFERAGRLVLQAKILDAQDGAILAAAEASARFSEDLKALALQPGRADEKNKPAQSAGDLAVELWSDKTEYVVGEKMQVHVRANQDCYLTIIDVGTSGAATVIFPNLYHPANDVKGGKTYTIPDPAAGFDFEVSGPRGTQRLRAVASKQPVVELQDVQNMGALTRDIKAAAKKTPAGQWSDAVLKLTIR